MKKLLIALFLSPAVFAGAQSNEPYQFKELVCQAATPVKSQDQTGTCWAFSTASFLESEVLRLGKPEVNLSEMFVVRNIYRMKCENYVRRQGAAQFGEGGLAHDMLNAVKKFGIVPESVYPGRKDPSKPFNHGQLEKNLKEKCKEFAQQGKESKLDPKWLAKIDEMLDQEFGPLPKTFSQDGKPYSPLTYRDFLGINPDDYVTITSFTHHPFWERFILEVPDNWSNGEFYNMPLDDMMRSVNYALNNKYTIEWDTDVSNTGFSAAKGIAIVPQVAFVDKSAEARNNAFRVWEPEKKVTQELRQELFDSQETMDDHLMHITGRVEEKQSGNFFVVKNSWGEQASDFKGYIYTSDAYMRLNTISYTLPKSALPEDVRMRFGIYVPRPAHSDAGQEQQQQSSGRVTPKPSKQANSKALNKQEPVPSVKVRPSEKPSNINSKQ